MTLLRTGETNQNIGMEATDRSQIIATRLLEALDELRSVLHSEGGPDWDRRFRETVSVVAEAYADHVDDAESPDGLLVDLTEIDPRLGAYVDLLRRDHTELAERFYRLLRSESDRVDLMEDTGELLIDLETHERLGADLLVRALGEELGESG